MAETLLSPSSIKLYGRVLSSLQYNNDTMKGAGGNNFLQHQLSAVGKNPLYPAGTLTMGSNKVTAVDPMLHLKVGMLVQGIIPAPPAARGAAGAPAASQAFPIGTYITKLHKTSFEISEFPLSASAELPITAIEPAVSLARIYAFSFEGSFYNLPKPVIFIVHGLGDCIEGHEFGRANLDEAGVVAKEWEFVSDMRGATPVSRWEYEKGDFSLRLDTEAGPFDQILLQAALRSGSDRGERSGMSLDGRSGMSLDSRSGMSVDTRSGMSLRNGR